MCKSTAFCSWRCSVWPAFWPSLLIAGTPEKPTMPSPPEGHSASDPQQGPLRHPDAGASLTWKQAGPRLYLFRWQAPPPVWPLTGCYTHDFKDTSLRWVLRNQTLSASEMAVWWHFTWWGSAQQKTDTAKVTYPKSSAQGEHETQLGRGKENGRFWVFS